MGSADANGGVSHRSQARGFFEVFNDIVRGTGNGATLGTIGATTGTIFGRLPSAATGGIMRSVAGAFAGGAYEAFKHSRWYE
ncbi:hypothetical protein [Bartonella rattaustraliani]|uniref:hypothetical protein n=1 Tax=Bartonella rattaustraliani TaxID=481139 RepID=UPI000317BD43|nr:hypothetical protein [Bartonella rattaustraliani]